MFMGSCFVAGQKLGHIHRGVELGCVSSMRVQVEGVRLLIVARITEVVDALQAEVADGTSVTISDMVDWLLRLDECPPATKMPSLVAGVVRVGDIMYLPAGYILVDKACVEDNVCLKLFCVRVLLVCCFEFWLIWLV